ncbi:MAG: PQQ-binding-like beta-propeller repeat protein [Fimbriimonadales bacterium]
MISLRTPLLGLAVATVGAALAISGPMPLGWRWLGKAVTAPTSAPVIDGNRLFVAVGRSVHALDATTGTELWSFPKGAELEGEFRATPAMAGDMIIASNTNKAVFGLNKNDGTKQWTFLLSSSVARHVLADGDLAYLFTSDNRIVAINTVSGSRAWASDFDINDAIVGRPVMHEGDLIFYTATSQLASFSTSKQKFNWVLNVGSVPIDGNPVIYDGGVFVVTGQQVAKINAKTGRPNWTRNFPAHLAGSVAMTPKGGVVATDDMKCFVFDLNGRLTSQKPIELRGYLAGSPQSLNETVLVKSRGGAMFLVDPSRPGGAVLWEYSTMPIVGMTRGGGTGATAGGTARAGQGGGTTNSSSAITSVGVIGPVAATDTAMYAIGDEGSVFAWGMDLGADETGPNIKMLTPPQGAHLFGGAGLNIVFNLSDETSGVMSKSIRVTLNGQLAKFDYEPGTGNLWIRIREGGSTAVGANPPLSDGRKTFTVSVADWVGNVTEKSFTIVVDNSLPVIKQRGDDVKPGGPSAAGGGGGSGSG